MIDELRKIEAEMRDHACSGWADALAAILASAPAAEPVAWRRFLGYDKKGKEEWHIWDYPNKPPSDENWEPVYAAPQPPPAPTHVEKLLDAFALQAWACGETGVCRVADPCYIEARTALLAAYRPAAVSGVSATVCPPNDYSEETRAALGELAKAAGQHAALLHDRSSRAELGVRELLEACQPYIVAAVTGFHYEAKNARQLQRRITDFLSAYPAAPTCPPAGEGNP